MRTLVCGSRYFNDTDLMAEVLSEYDITLLIHGAARGADTLAGDYASLRGIEVEVYPAKWGEHGKAAGPIRNTQMLKEGKPDLVIAFLGPNSRGTANMIAQAEKAGVPVKVISI